MVTKTIAIKVWHLGMIFSQLLGLWMVVLTVMKSGVDDALVQFLMESAIYGVLDLMIKVLLEIAGAGDGDEGDDDALGQRPHHILMESS